MRARPEVFAAPTAIIAAVVIACGVGFAGCSSSGSSPSGSRSGSTTTVSAASSARLDRAERPHAVGETMRTFVDARRTTAAHGSSPALPDRTLSTTILYPAAGAASTTDPVPDAPADRADGPYPLIVFAHGLGANPGLYQPLLERWAAAGFVVAAPLFPLTNTATPGGAVAGDVIHQPGDVSYVITSVLALSRDLSAPLAGLVDAQQVGVAGHSNGAITTLGIAANSCCRDRRVQAAIVMAGTAEGYPKGRYDFAHTPPMLIVHGTGDVLIPYADDVDVFNRLRGPKTLLTIKGGGHAAAAGLDDASAGVVDRVTIDFLDAYLRHDRRAEARLKHDGASNDTKVTFVSAVGSTATVPTVPTPKRNLHATVTPSRGLTGGQEVRVTWRGYTPATVVNVLQCSAGAANLTDSGACDYTHAALLHTDPSGAGSLDLEIVQGPTGSGVCDATHRGCFILVNDASSPDLKSSVKVPISFAP